MQNQGGRFSILLFMIIILSSFILPLGFLSSSQSCFMDLKVMQNILQFVPTYRYLLLILFFNFSYHVDRLLLAWQNTYEVLYCRYFPISFLPYFFFFFSVQFYFLVVYYLYYNTKSLIKHSIRSFNYSVSQHLLPIQSKEITALWVILQTQILSFKQIGYKYLYLLLPPSSKRLPFHLQNFPSINFTLTLVFSSIRKKKLPLKFPRPPIPWIKTEVKLVSHS